MWKSSQFVSRDSWLMLHYFSELISDFFEMASIWLCVVRMYWVRTSSNLFLGGCWFDVWGGLRELFPLHEKFRCFVYTGLQVLNKDFFVASCTHPCILLASWITPNFLEDMHYFYEIAQKSHNLHHFLTTLPRFTLPTSWLVLRFCC